jgi:hypothetical protein
MESKIDANAFADAVWEALPEHVEEAKKKGVLEPQMMLSSAADLGAGFCGAWKKYAPLAKSALGWLTYIYPSVAVFLLGVLSAVEKMIIPAVCGISSTAAPEVQSNVSQKAR